MTASGTRLSFREQMLRAREDAIIRAVLALLAEKGFEAMTVDEVAAAVGIAKASLYKHFPSKEDLAAAAMVRTLHDAHAFLDTLAPADPPLARLRAVVRWAMAMQLQGRMPALPSHNSTLRAALLSHKAYVDALMRLSDRLGAWIEAAQTQGELAPGLPPIAVLYTLYARACDPVLEFLQATGLYDEERILDIVTGVCFEGLRAR